MGDEQSYLIQMIITAVTTLLASSGFWLYMVKRMELKHEEDMRMFERRDAIVKLLTGIAHDKIVYLALQFIEHGHLTMEEYESLYKYLYIPYLELGGNGTAKRLMEMVIKLPIVKAHGSNKHDLPEDQEQ